MCFALSVTLLALTVTELLSAQPTNCSARNEGIAMTGGVCKADYGSRFNIDSKELMGTTCVSRNRGVSKIMSSRLKQALERMKEDFQQLQDLIDKEVSLRDSEAFGNAWRTGSLNVHRDYQKQQKSSGDKVEMLYNDPSMATNVRDALENDQALGVFHPQTNFYGQTGLLFDNSRKNIPDALENRAKMGGGNTFRHEPFSEYNPMKAYEQQRILADIKVEPDIKENGGTSVDDVEEKIKCTNCTYPFPPLV